MGVGLVTLTVFVTRKPGLSPTAFKDHYENTHVPLLRSLAGPIFPLSHARHYLARDPATPDHPAIVIFGAPEAFDYDAFAEVTFESETALHKFQKVMMLPEVMEDEDRFTDRAKLKVVAMGDTAITKRD